MYEFYIKNMFVCFKKEDRQQAVMLQAACKKRTKTINIVIAVAIIAIYLSQQGVSDLGYTQAHVSFCL